MNHFFLTLFNIIKWLFTFHLNVSPLAPVTQGPHRLWETPRQPKDRMTWSFRTMTATSKKISFWLKAGGSVRWLSALHQFQYRFYSIWQKYFMVCGLRFREFPCFIKSGAFSVFFALFCFSWLPEDLGECVCEKKRSKNVFTIFNCIYLWCAGLCSLSQRCAGWHRSARPDLRPDPLIQSNVPSLLHFSALEVLVGTPECRGRKLSKCYCPPPANFLPGCELRCVCSFPASFSRRVTIWWGWLPSASMNFTLPNSAGLRPFTGSLSGMKVTTGSRTESRCW